MILLSPITPTLYVLHVLPANNPQLALAYVFLDKLAGESTLSFTAEEIGQLLGGN